MAKYIELSADNSTELCKVAKALSSPVRIEILKLLYNYSFNINEISEKLNIPASSTGMHIKALENAKLINTEQQPGGHGAMKLCSRRSDFVTIRLKAPDHSENRIKTTSMPVGAFTDCEIYPTCGLATVNGIIGNEDFREVFYSPERMDAQILWSAAGYVEYRFPNLLPQDVNVKKISVSMEICSEAPNYREDWKSDITMWINNIECGTWTSPGDFGERRGRLTPEWMEYGTTQYGLLTTWMMSSTGSFINGQKVSNEEISKTRISSNYYISIRIGNKPNAKYIGGFNIFGKCCGDYAQDIILTVEY